MNSKVNRKAEKKPAIELLNIRLPKRNNIGIITAAAITPTIRQPRGFIPQHKMPSAIISFPSGGCVDSYGSSRFKCSCAVRTKYISSKYAPYRCVIGSFIALCSSTNLVAASPLTFTGAIFLFSVEITMTSPILPRDSGPKTNLMALVLLCPKFIRSQEQKCTCSAGLLS